MKNKYIGLVLGLVIIFSFFYLQQKLLLNTLSGLINIKDELGKLYLKNTSFKLASDDDQIQGGHSEKYVLIDNLGKKWLFKSSKEETEQIKTIIAYKLANFLGVNTPSMYPFNITINNIVKQGFMIEMLPPKTKFINLNAEYLENKNDIFISSLKNIFFSWWVFCTPGSHDCIEIAITPSGTIFQIDMNNAFGFKEQDAYEFRENEYPNALLQLKKSDAEFNKLNTFIQHSMTIKNNQIKKYLAAHLNRHVPKSANNKANDIDLILERKKLLLKHFLNIYSISPENTFNTFDNIKLFTYRLNLCKNFVKDSLQIIVKLPFLKKKFNQNNLEFVSSGDAWRYLKNNFDIYDEADFNSDSDFNKLFPDVVSKLLAMRRNSSSYGEKIAITIYLRQVRTCEQHINKFGYSSEHHIMPWRRFSYNLKTLKHPKITDQWYHSIDYMSTNVVSVANIEGESEYINGLINLANDQQRKAIPLLLAAKNMGYAVDEISEIIETHLSIK